MFWNSTLQFSEILLFANMFKMDGVLFGACIKGMCTLNKSVLLFYFFLRVLFPGTREVLK